MINTGPYRINVLTWLIAFLFLVPGITDIVRGVRQGMALVAAGKEDGLHEKSTFYGVTREPVTYSISGLAAGNDFPVRWIEMQSEGMISLPAQFHQPVWMKIGSLIFVLIGMSAYIYLIVRVFVAVPSVANAGLINRKNIRRLRQIGIALLISAVFFYLSQAVDVFFVRQIADLENYRIVYPSVPGELTVALIILLLTEVLKIGNRLQEEQELTI